MVATQKIVGHQKQRQRLYKLLKSNRLQSALVFSGPAGIGKKLIAIELVQSLICQSQPAQFGGCHNCKTCQLLIAGNYPDLSIIQCDDKEAASVDQMRANLKRLSFRSYSGGIRAIIFDNAELLSAACLNMLLKSVEEPRPNTYYLFITCNPTKLLPTLLSRCQRWYFDSLSSDEIALILDQQNNPNAHKIALLADGSIANIELINEHSDAWSALQIQLTDIAAGDIAKAITTAKELTSDKATLSLKIDFIRIFARKKMFDDPYPDASINYNKWALLVENSIVANQLISERHLNANLVMTNMLLSLAASEPEFKSRLTEIVI